MRRFVYAAAALLCSVAFAVSAPVREVSIVNSGKGPLDESAARAQVKTAAGAEFDQGRLSADVRKLLDTGLYESVEAGVEKSDDGVRVVLRLRQNRRLAGPLALSGVERFSEGDVREWIGLYAGDRVSDAIVGARVQKVLEKYREDLYADAAVSWTLSDVEQAEGTASLTVQVREGERRWVREVRFPGATLFSAATLRTALGMRAWYNPGRLFWKEPFDASNIDLGRPAIKEWYAETGHLDAEVGRAEVGEAPGGGVSVSVPVSEGPIYRIGAVSFQGIERFPEPDIRREAGLTPGAVASSILIDGAAQRVRNYYGFRGYVDTTVQTALATDPATGTVGVRMLVREGELVTIRNVRIRGNAVTRDKVLRRELTVYPGDMLNEVEAARSERRLQNLGFLSSVRHYTEETTLPGERDLVYEIEEGRSGQMMVGAGFSSVDHMMLFLDVSHGNFDLAGWPYRGGGQKLKLSAQLGGTRRDISVSFTEPWFLDRRLQLGTELYHTDVDYTDYELRRYGGALSLTKGIIGRIRGTVQYRIERETVTDLADTNIYMYIDGPEDTSAVGYDAVLYGGTNRFAFAEQYGRLTSALRLGLSYDDRDHPFIPKNGVQLSGYVQASGGYLGGDTDIWQTGLKTAYYVSPWLGHVISVQASYDAVESFGDTEEVPIGSRLFAGGGRTIRGFSYRHVGPKVAPVSGDAIRPHDYRPFGGKSRAVGNVEYTIPLFSMLRLAAFYDTGNVWSDAFEVDLSHLAASAGVGLRFDVPGFPMRIDRAWVLHKDDDLTEEDIVVFWIGY
jgi:outer membrane protein insertion porin family